MSPTKLTYRPDIDGLRGLAILFVVLYHAFPHIFPAGFIGVDVFFTISGYLITKIILESWRDRRFLRTFYARRIRRLFPALILVFVASIIAGKILLIDVELNQLLRHVAGGTGFVSNFVLLKEIGYFDSLAENKPLLHLWSLSIEEQFYIFWSFVLLVISRYRLNLRGSTFLVTLVSFIICLILSHTKPEMAFYSPLSRMWEILLGALVAMTAITDTKDVRLSFLGVGLLVAGMFVVRKDGAFPAPSALLPTLATAPLILVPGSWFNRKVLSQRFLVGVGLISYPLYLWHWPLLSFARIVTPAEPTPLVRGGLMGAAFVLAALTYFLVERPLRKKSGALSVGILLVLMSAVGVFAAIQSRGGRFQDIPPFMPDPRLAWSPVGLEEYCLPDSNTLDLMHCQAWDKTKPPTVALIGDSNASHFLVGLGRAYAAQGDNVVGLARSACIAFYDVILPIGTGPGCRRLMDKALEVVMNTPTIHTVIISHRFKIWEVQTSKGPAKSSIEAYRMGFELTVKKLLSAHKKVALVFAIPEMPRNPSGCKKDDDPNEELACVVKRSTHDEHQREIRQAVESVIKKFPEVATFYTDKYLCDEKYCWARRHGIQFYHDEYHLTTPGSSWFAQRMVKQFNAFFKQQKSR